jgi:hypothetical protein
VVVLEWDWISEDSKMGKLIFFTACLFFSYKTSASSVDYDCSVKDFTTFSGDDDDLFVKKNLKKRYVLSLRESEIIVTSISNYSTPSTNVLKIYGINNTFGEVKAMDEFGKHIILGKDSGNAVYSIVNSMFANSWQLNCKKQLVNWGAYERSR